MGTIERTRRSEKGCRGQGNTRGSDRPANLRYDGRRSGPKYGTGACEKIACRRNAGFFYIYLFYICIKQKIILV